MPILPRINVSLEDDIFEALTAEAETTGRSVADVVRERLRVSLFGEGHSPPPRNVGELAQALLAEGMTDEQALSGVLDAFPDASTSKKSIAWYRSDMKKKGLPVLSQLEARKRQAQKA